MAKKTAKLSIRVNDKEQIWGIIYLLFSVFLLPSLIQMLNGLLATPLNRAWCNFLCFLLNFVFIILIFHDFFKRSITYIGRNFWRYLLVVLTGALIYGLASWGLAALLRLLLPGFENLNDLNIIVMLHDNFVIMLIGTVLLVPVAEEALYRGLIFGSLYPKNHTMAYILSAVIFAAVHVVGYINEYTVLEFLVAFLQYIPAGLILAGAYRCSGSIFAPILIHAVINAVGLLAMR